MPSSRWLCLACLVLASSDEPSPCVRDTSDPGVAHLCTWLEEQCEAVGLGRIFKGVFDHDGASVHGLGVVSDIAAGENIMCINSKCGITEDVLENAESDAELCTETHHLAVWLAEERRKENASFYAPFLSNLPGEEHFKQFHPAYLEGYALDKNIDYWGLWNLEIEECHARRAHPTLAEMKLAYVQLISRQHEVGGFMPLLDLINTGAHDEINSEPEFTDDGMVCLKADRALRAGEEILIDYGLSMISPMLSFIMYGFSLSAENHNLAPPNPEEELGDYILSPEDDCAGLRPPDFVVPESAGPVLQKYVEFSRRYCSGSNTGSVPKEEL